MKIGTINSRCVDQELITLLHDHLQIKIQLKVIHYYLTLVILV